MPAVSKMKNSKTFRILELPYVALKEVLSMWSTLDLINFSLINSKTKRITKLVTKCFSKKRKANFTFNSHSTLAIGKRSNGYGYRMTDDKAGSNQLITDGNDEVVCLKYADDSLNGFMKWSEYVIQVLNCRIWSVEFFVDQIPDQIISIIDWLKTLTSTFFECELKGKKESDDVLHHILDNFKITNSIYIHVPTKENFTAKLPKPLYWLFIQPSKWVTLQQILEVDCEKIQTRCSSLSNQDLANFVTSWMTMKSNLRINNFETHIQNETDFFEIVKGIPEDRICFGTDEDTKIRFHWAFNGLWTVTRDDGKQAVLFTSRFMGQFYLHFVTN